MSQEAIERTEALRRRAEAVAQRAFAIGRRINSAQEATKPFTEQAEELKAALAEGDSGTDSLALMAAETLEDNCQDVVEIGARLLALGLAFAERLVGIVEDTHRVEKAIRADKGG